MWLWLFLGAFSVMVSSPSAEQSKHYREWQSCLQQEVLQSCRDYTRTNFISQANSRKKKQAERCAQPPAPSLPTEMCTEPGLPTPGLNSRLVKASADVGKPEPQLVPDQGNPWRRQEASELNPFPMLLHCQRNETNCSHGFHARNRWRHYSSISSAGAVTAHPGSSQQWATHLWMWSQHSSSAFMVILQHRSSQTLWDQEGK